MELLGVSLCAPNPNEESKSRCSRRTFSMFKLVVPYSVVVRVEKLERDVAVGTAEAPPQD